ncbi:hypothetical protein N8T08_003711 [Aspergillus melleus]|uniref:Uncharacterized protein n=1 Tax=Aspergillus melleus TaxID=138277 RepID=A0ACC3B6X7_9EURO|nr:hypothetical protein N8T08_003711 [Aspergillus melleus]
MPTDLPPAAERLNPHFTQERPKPQSAASSFSPQEPPPRDESVMEANAEFYYDGEIRLIYLAKTLQRIQNPQSRYEKAASSVVMFSGASLKAVSDLLPLACHSRPDYAQWSTDSRMQGAVTRALGYLQFYLQPQVMITQGVTLEDSFFSKGMELATQRHGLPHIALPGYSRELMWISLLNSSALRAWNQIQIEILIQAPSEFSGSVIRLLRSLEEADYLGSTPSLTIELPQHVDPRLLQYLRKMKWPFTPSKVTIRRHILPHTLKPAEASLKTVEAFYPRDPNTSHVLMLSPQTELSASFYHFLKYAILNYRHPSATGRSAQNLFGISLELPSSLPTNGEPFRPSRSDVTFTDDGNRDTLPLSLWQAPNSNAALYFGDKWVELHSFLSKRLYIQDFAVQDLPQQKIISKKYPAVMEYLLELIRASGYYMLYPAFEASGPALATVHNELYHAPEEFTTHVSSELPDAERMDNDNDVLQPPKESVEKPVSRAPTLMPLLDQFSMSLPAIDTMPLLSYAGHEISRAEWNQNTRDYIQKFRIRHGGCSTQAPVNANSVSLFCVDDENTGDY